MSIKKYYSELVTLKRNLAQQKLPSNNSNTDDGIFEWIKHNLESYTYTNQYLLNDINNSNDDTYTLDTQVNLIVRINQHGIGYIKHSPHIHDLPLTPLTREQAKELRKMAQELSEAALKIVINPNLTDYVGTRNKFDYDSIIVYLESVTFYLFSIHRLLEIENDSNFF